MSTDVEKQNAARAAVDLIEDGMIVGLGSGSTSLIFVRMLGERVKNGLKIKGVPTSDETAMVAREVGIELISLDQEVHPDLDVDGADEVDSNLNMIKGGGGKLLREKIVAFAAKEVIIMVDSTKLVEKLGKFTVPVEIVPFSQPIVEIAIEDIGGKPVLRKAKDGSTYITDEKNHILDCDFGLIDDAESLARKLSNTPGVVEHGLFIDLADLVLVGENDGVRQII
ncbi:ribose-5-phosphate isomerase RpiA [Candidatus Obscuribacterales bacterium]|nr:ribose-5-phosphate isomerase RpiA [Candidatus Obscuribacterales bacterium]MBX3138868.1 ribose-5-phosphate isomerase RpiA [Candidatus Obscuribacterales bacterium]MBX3151536.1 ribose-5-phosphate isomerase RpiA [Candidatus Obscuribacterales bacterium]